MVRPFLLVSRFSPRLANRRAVKAVVGVEEPPGDIEDLMVLLLVAENDFLGLGGDKGPTVVAVEAITEFRFDDTPEGAVINNFLGDIFNLVVSSEVISPVAKS